MLLCEQQMHAESKEHLVEEMLLAIQKVWGYRCGCLQLCAPVFDFQHTLLALDIQDFCPVLSRRNWNLSLQLAANSAGLMMA
jgi:hypothetical protein